MKPKQPHAPPEVEVVDRAVQRLVGSAAADGYSSITVIERTLSMLMPEDARARSEALQKKWAPRMRCSAYLIEGTGFKAAAVRGLTATMNLMSKTPVRTFADAPGASQWVAPHASLLPEEVERALKETRSIYAMHAAIG